MVFSLRGVLHEWFNNFFLPFSGFREVKAWKLAREALRVRREKARKVKESLVSSAKPKAPSPVENFHNTETAMSSQRGVARNVQQGWNEGLYGNVFREENSEFARNSNFNNSRGYSKPGGYILPTSPPSRLPPDQDVDEEYVDADEIDEDIYETASDIPKRGPLTRIMSLPSGVDDDIIMTSSAAQSLPTVLHEESIEDIYDTADSVMQSNVQPSSSDDHDYYNYEDVVDEIYDDTASLREDLVRINAQGSISNISSRPNASQLPEIEEDIYDDTTVSIFRRDYPTSVRDPENDEMYTDVSSVFEQPPPPVLKQTRANTHLPPPPQPHRPVIQLPPQQRTSAEPLPSREVYKQTRHVEEAVYSDAAAVFQSPPLPQKTKPPPSPQLPSRKPYRGTAAEQVEEEDNPTYSDAASIFQSPPAKTLSGSSRFPPLPVLEADEQSDTYTYLTEVEVDQMLSEEPVGNTNNRSSNGKTKLSPPPLPIPVRSPNTSLATTSIASRRTISDSSLASLEDSPPLPPPRKSSMNSNPDAPPLPSRTNFRTQPTSYSPGVQRKLLSQRSRATKTRSTSDPPSPLTPSGFGLSDLPNYFSNPSKQSHRPSSKLLERTKSSDEVFFPPPNVRLSKRFSEPSTHGYVPKQQVSRTVLPIPPKHLREDDASQEDYAEIVECVELDLRETPITSQPQEYSAPIPRSNPSVHGTQRRSSVPLSPPSYNQNDRAPPPLPPVILVGERPKAPLPSEALMATKFKSGPEKPVPLQNNLPPSKPPRAAKTSLGGPARSTASSVGAPPPPPVRTTPLLGTLPRPTATPPAPPVRKSSHLTSSNPPASVPPPAPPSHVTPSQALSQSPTDVPPPPPPPPPVGQTKFSMGSSSTLTQPRSSQSQSSHTPPAAPTDNLLAGIQNIQLKKATEREVLQVKPPPSNGGPFGPGNLMAEMQSFKFRKTKKIEPETVPEVTSNVNTNDPQFRLKPTPSLQAPPVSPRLNNPHQMRKNPPTIPSHKTNLSSSPPLNGHVTSTDPTTDVSSDRGLPEWKRALLEKKRREQQVHMCIL